MCWTFEVTLAAASLETFCLLVLCCRGLRYDRPNAYLILPLVLQEWLQVVLWAHIGSSSTECDETNQTVSIAIACLVCAVPAWMCTQPLLCPVDVTPGASAVGEAVFLLCSPVRGEWHAGASRREGIWLDDVDLHLRRTLAPPGLAGDEYPVQLLSGLNGKPLGPSSVICEPHALLRRQCRWLHVLPSFLCATCLGLRRIERIDAGFGPGKGVGFLLVLPGLTAGARGPTGALALPALW